MAPTVRRAAGSKRGLLARQVADEHTGPGTGRAGTDGAEGQREMRASLVKNVVGFKREQGQCFRQSFHHSGERQIRLCVKLKL